MSRLSSLVDRHVFFAAACFLLLLTTTAAVVVVVEVGASTRRTTLTLSLRLPDERHEERMWVRRRMGSGLVVSSNREHEEDEEEETEIASVSLRSLPSASTVSLTHSPYRPRQSLWCEGKENGEQKEGGGEEVRD